MASEALMTTIYYQLEKTAKDYERALAELKEADANRAAATKALAMAMARVFRETTGEPLERALKRAGRSGE